MSFLKQYSYGFIGKIIPQSIFLFTSMILARFLSPEDFGQVGVLMIFISIATTLNDSGLGGSLINQKRITKLDENVVFSYNICISVILYIIIFLSAPFIELYFNNHGLASVARYLCIIFILDSLGMVPKTILYRNLEFDVVAQISIIASSLAAFISILLAFITINVYALVSYYISNSLISSILCIYKSKYKLELAFDIKILKKLLPFGIYTTLSNVIDACYESSLTVLTGKFLSISQAGYLSQAKKLEDASSQSLGQTINTVSFPILRRIENQSELIVESHKIVLSIILIIVPILLTISLFGKEIIGLLYGNSWTNAGIYLSLLMIAGIFIILEIVYRNFIKSTGLVKYLFKTTVYKRIIALALIIITIVIFPPSYIIGSYIIGSLIGLIFNIRLYTIILNQKFSSELNFIYKLILPSIIYYIIGLIINTCFISNYIVRLSYSFFSIIILIKIIYPALYKFNISKYLSNIINKNG